MSKGNGGIQVVMQSKKGGTSCCLCRQARRGWGGARQSWRTRGLTPQAGCMASQPRVVAQSKDVWPNLRGSVQRRPPPGRRLLRR